MRAGAFVVGREVTAGERVLCATSVVATIGKATTGASHGSDQRTSTVVLFGLDMPLASADSGSQPEPVSPILDSDRILTEGLAELTTAAWGQPTLGIRVTT